MPLWAVPANRPLAQTSPGIPRGAVRHSALGTVRHSALAGLFFFALRSPGGQETLPYARLAIAGSVFDPAYLEGLKRLAAEFGAARRIEFLGTRTDVPDLMRRAEALLLCSESEAFGWVVLEAMANNAPVIASSVDGPREIIEHERTGLLVRCRDVAAYAAAMRRLLACPGLGASLAENARRMAAQRFSAAAMVKGIQAAYREVLDRRDS